MVDNLVKFRVYSESEWVYPDDTLEGFEEEATVLDVARGGCRAFSIFNFPRV